MKSFSGDQRFEASDVFRMLHPMGNNDSKLAGDCCQKDIRFGSCMVPAAFASNTHIGLEMVDSPFDTGPDFIEGIPFRRIPLDSWEHTEFHVFVGISGPAFLCR